jgi:hypothetical protein
MHRQPTDNGTCPDRHSGATRKRSKKGLGQSLRAVLTEISTIRASSRLNSRVRPVIDGSLALDAQAILGNAPLE